MLLLAIGHSNKPDRNWFFMQHAGMTSFVYPSLKEYYIFTHRFYGRVNNIKK